MLLPPREKVGRLLGYFFWRLLFLCQLAFCQGTYHNFFLKIPFVGFHTLLRAWKLTDRNQASCKTNKQLSVFAMFTDCKAYYQCAVYLQNKQVNVYFCSAYCLEGALSGWCWAGECWDGHVSGNWGLWPTSVVQSHPSVNCDTRLSRLCRKVMGIITPCTQRWTYMQNGQWLFKM